MNEEFIDDVVVLTANYKLSITVSRPSSFGTGREKWASFTATATIENEGTRLSGWSNESGDADNALELREQVVRAAVANVARKLRAIKALE